MSLEPKTSTIPPEDISVGAEAGESPEPTEAAEEGSQTEINVIMDTGQGKAIGELSQEERDFFFDQLLSENAHLGRATVDAFSEMVVALAEETTRWTMPTLKELLLRQAVSMGSPGGASCDHVVTPIVPDFPDSFAARITGAAAFPSRRVAPRTHTKPKTVENSINVSFNRPTLVVTVGGLEYFAPRGENVSVIGLKVRSLCSAERPKSDCELTDILTRMSYSAMATVCDRMFARPDYRINLLGDLYAAAQVMLVDLPADETTGPVVDATGELRNMKALANVYNYLVAFEQHAPERMPYVYSQVRTAAQGKGNKRLLSAVGALAPTPPMDMSTPSGPKPSILNTLEELNKCVFSTSFAIGLLADVYGRGASQIYYGAINRGADDVEVLERLESMKRRNAVSAFNLSLRAKAEAQKASYNSYMRVITSKLGKARAVEIEQLMQTKRTQPEKVLDLLQPQERQLVALEHARRQKYVEALLNNKCGHVALYRQFRAAVDDLTVRAKFSSLRHFFAVSDGPTDQMITCKNCKFEIMCPHLRLFTEMNLANARQTEMRSRLTQYIDKAVIGRQQHCKICGEGLVFLDSFVEDDSVEPATMDEELGSFVWSEVASCVRYVKFGALVDTSRLITSIRDICYPHIAEIEKQIFKSKTASAEEIKAKKRVYTAIYAFAYLVHLVHTNATEIAFRGIKETAIVPLIRHAVELVMNSRNIALKSIPGMTTEIVRNVLIEAYKSLQGAAAKIETHAGSTEDVVAALSFDPIYRYYYNVNVADDILNGKKPPGLSDLPILRAEDILGVSLETAADLFERARVPSFKKWGELDVGPFSCGGLYRKGRLVFEQQHLPYAAESFRIFDYRVKHKLHDESIYVDISADKHRADRWSQPKVILSEKHAEHKKLYDDLAAKESILTQYRQFAAAHAYYWPSASSESKSRKSQDTGTSISTLYDESGTPHNWSICVMDDNTETTAKEISKSVESGTRRTAQVVDQKCSVCGVLRSAAAGTFDPSVIRRSLRAKIAVSNFFKYYERRCPKGALHSQDAVCRKCGISRIYFADPSSKEAMEFYEKYKKTYDQERELPSLATQPPAQITEDRSFDYSNWSPNFNAVLELSDRLKVNQRLISAIGATFGQNYADIQNGTYVPVDVSSRYETRVFAVDSHVKRLITEYNQLRFSHRSAKPSARALAILEAAGVDKSEVEIVLGELTSIHDDYTARFNSFRAVKKPQETVVFCIQTLCEKCLLLWDVGSRSTKKLRREFVASFIKRTLRGDELVSNPGHFSWAALYKNKEPKDKESPGEEYEKPTEEESADEFEEEAPPFSMDAFDIDRDPDDDPDDPGNELRVGEEYGLS